MDNISNAKPEEFIAMGASPEQAADLARQADALAGRRGFAAQAEVAHGMDDYVPSTPAPAQYKGDATAAQAEWDRLTADRAAGTISNFVWNNPTEVARRDALVATIAGTPQAEKPTTQQLTDMAIAHDQQPMDAALEQHFAPPAAAHEYKFPYPVGTPTDEAIASDSALKAAMHAEALPKSLVESIATNLRSTATALANETPAAMQSRIDSNRARMTTMWSKEGLTFDAAMQTIDAQLEQWTKNATLRPFIEKSVRFLTPLDWDAILQVAKFRNNQRTKP
jgi:hypothetical protein